MARWASLARVALLLAALAGSASAVKIRVAPRHTECVTETATEPGDLITGSYVGINAGKGVFFKGMSGQVFDMEVKSPSGEVIYNLKRKAEFKFEFHVEEEGAHSVCFTNLGRGASDLLYHAHVGHHVDHAKAVASQLDPMLETIRNLEEDLAELREEQIYQVEHEEAHRLTNESTNKRVVVYSILEASALIGLGLFQVMYVRRLFERKEMLRA